MARPRLSEEPRVTTAVRLPESVHRRLHDTALARAVSANLLVTRAVEEFLDRLPTVEESLSGSSASRVSTAVPGSIDKGRGSAGGRGGTGGRRRQRSGEPARPKGRL